MPQPTNNKMFPSDIVCLIVCNEHVSISQFLKFRLISKRFNRIITTHKGCLNRWRRMISICEQTLDFTKFAAQFGFQRAVIRHFCFKTELRRRKPIVNAQNRLRVTKRRIEKLQELLAAEKNKLETLSVALTYHKGNFNSKQFAAYKRAAVPRGWGRCKRPKRQTTIVIDLR